MVILVRRCFDFISVRSDRLDRPRTVNAGLKRELGRVKSSR